MRIMTFRLRTRLHKAKLVVVGLLLTTPLFALANAEKITILTDQWSPYINAENQQRGSAARLIEILFDYEDVSTHWRYMPYELSYLQVKNQKSLLSFPYFKTPQREKEVLFSNPVFSVSSKVYYNRQFLSKEEAENRYSEKTRIGRVAGYSYGVGIDKVIQQATIFASERQALTALLNNDIDVLPMTEGVMNHELKTHFPHRKELIVALAGVKETSGLHVIAANNATGQAVIDQLNGIIADLNAEGVTSLRTTTVAEPSPIDVAKLITSEGYPLIIGQSEKSGSNILYYTLPQGSQALVIEWSSKIMQPSGTDRIYKNMMDLSKIVMLNGPHVGKELYVRNMHIELM